MRSNSNSRNGSKEAKNGMPKRENNPKTRISPDDYPQIQKQIFGGGRRIPPRDAHNRRSREYSQRKQESEVIQRKDYDQGSQFSQLSSRIANITDEDEFAHSLKLSEEVRTALSQIQRFDLVLYGREACRICLEPMASEFKRLEKIKNSNKKMRIKYFDNELTVIAISNLLKYINHMNTEIDEFKVQKQKFEHDERIKKQKKFKQDLESRRNKNFNVKKEEEMAKAMIAIDKCITERDQELLFKKLTIFLEKYQYEDSVKSYVTIYQFLLEELQQRKERSYKGKYLIEKQSGKETQQIEMSKINEAIEKLRRENEELAEQIDSFGYLSKKVEQIRKKVLLHQDWDEELQDLKVSRSVSSMELSNSLLSVFSQFKKIIGKKQLKNESDFSNNPILDFVITLVRINSDRKLTHRIKEEEIRNLLKKYGVSEVQILEELPGRMIKSMSSEYVSEEISDLPKSEKVSEIHEKNKRNLLSPPPNQNETRKSAPEAPKLRLKTLTFKADEKNSQNYPELELQLEQYKQSNMKLKAALLKSKDKESLEKQKRELEIQKENLESERLLLNEQFQGLREMKQSDKNYRNFFGWFEIILDKMKNNMNWEKEVEKMTKEKEKCGNPLAVLFVQFNEHVKGFKKNEMNSLMNEIGKALASIRQVFSNITFNNIRRGKEVTKIIESLAKKKNQTSELKQEFLETISAIGSRIEEEYSAIADKNRRNEMVSPKKLKEYQSQNKKLSQENKDLYQKIREVSVKKYTASRHIQTENIEEKLEKQFMKEAQKFQTMKREKQKIINQVELNQRSIQKMAEDVGRNINGLFSPVKNKKKIDTLISIINRFIQSNEGKKVVYCENISQKGVLSLSRYLVDILNHMKGSEDKGQPIFERKRTERSERAPSVQGKNEGKGKGNSKEKEEIIEEFQAKEKNYIKMLEDVDKLQKIANLISEGRQWRKQIPSKQMRNENLESIFHVLEIYEENKFKENESQSEGLVGHGNAVRDLKKQKQIDQLSSKLASLEQENHDLKKQNLGLYKKSSQQSKEKEKEKDKDKDKETEEDPLKKYFEIQNSVDQQLKDMSQILQSNNNDDYEKILNETLAALQAEESRNKALERKIQELENKIIDGNVRDSAKQQGKEQIFIPKNENEEEKLEKLLSKYESFVEDFHRLEHEKNEQISELQQKLKGKQQEEKEKYKDKDKEIPTNNLLNYHSECEQKLNEQKQKINFLENKLNEQKNLLRQKKEGEIKIKDNQRFLEEENRKINTLQAIGKVRIDELQFIVEQSRSENRLLMDENLKLSEQINELAKLNNQLTAEIKQLTVNVQQEDQKKKLKNIPGEKQQNFQNNEEWQRKYNDLFINFHNYKLDVQAHSESNHKIVQNSKREVQNLKEILEQKEKEKEKKKYKENQNQKDFKQEKSQEKNSLQSNLKRVQSQNEILKSELMESQRRRNEIEKKIFFLQNDFFNMNHIRDLEKQESQGDLRIKHKVSGTEDGDIFDINIHVVLDENEERNKKLKKADPITMDIDQILKLINDNEFLQEKFNNVREILRGPSSRSSRSSRKRSEDEASNSSQLQVEEKQTMITELEKINARLMSDLSTRDTLLQEKEQIIKKHETQKKNYEKIIYEELKNLKMQYYEIVESSDGNHEESNPRELKQNLNMKLAEVSQDRDRMEREITDLNEKLQNAEIELEAFKQNFREKSDSMIYKDEEEEKNESRKMMDELIEKQTEHSRKQKNLISRISELERKYEQSMKQEQTLLMQIKQLEKQLQQEQQKNHHHHYQNLKKSNLSIREDNQKLSEIMIDERAKWKSEIYKNQELQIARNKIQALKMEVESQTGAINAYQTRVKVLQNQEKKLISEIQGKDEEIKAKIKEIEVLREDREKLQLTKMESEYEMVRIELVKKEKEISDKNLQIQKLQAHQAEILKENNQQLLKFEEKMKDYENQVQQYHENLKLSEQKNNYLRKQSYKIIKKKGNSSEIHSQAVSLKQETKQSGDEYEEDPNDELQIQILRRINDEMKVLIEENRMLQMKVALMEGHKHSLDHNCQEMITYFLQHQQKMERLMQWLFNEGYIKNGHTHADFVANANIYLHRINVGEYMKLWLEFMQKLFKEVIENERQELKGREDLKYKEIEFTYGNFAQKDLKKGIQDIRWIFAEYLTSRSEKYLQLMKKELGVEIV